MIHTKKQKTKQPLQYNPSLEEEDIAQEYMSEIILNIPSPETLVTPQQWKKCLRENPCYAHDTLWNNNEDFRKWYAAQLNVEI
jgi:hypothetical protein